MSAVELAASCADPAYFLHHFGTIDDTQGHGAGTGTMPFHLWPAQTNVLWQFAQHRLVLILKARQLGISWLSCGYALWRCLTQPGQLVLLFSRLEGDAEELLRRCQVLYDRLPPWMQASLPALDRNVTGQLAWANGSRIESLASTKNAGRGNAASLVIIDEAAFQPHAKALFTALKPTIDGGGQLIILSTANGVGNLFHQLWGRVAENHFTPIFLPWWSRPGRSRAWYNAQLAEYTDPAMVKQEYPASATEAFLVSGRVRFAADWIAAQAPNLRPGLPSAQWPASLRDLDGLTVYALPTPGQRVVLGADVAEGLEHGDYSVGLLLAADTGEELALLRGHYEPDLFAAHLDALARAYRARLAVERNNHGHAVLASLRRLDTPNLYAGPDGRLGHVTSTQGKPLAMATLATALRDGAVTVRSAVVLGELQIYRYAANGATSAPPDYYDDGVMALSIALHVAALPFEHARPVRSYTLETY